MKEGDGAFTSSQPRFSERAISRYIGAMPSWQAGLREAERDDGPGAPEGNRGSGGFLTRGSEGEKEPAGRGGEARGSGAKKAGKREVGRKGTLARTDRGKGK